MSYTLFSTEASLPSSAQPFPEGDTAGLTYEDGGQALVAQVEGTSPHLFVRLQSWDESTLHPELSAALGKRIRVTVEVLD